MFYYTLTLNMNVYGQSKHEPRRKLERADTALWDITLEPYVNIKSKMYFFKKDILYEKEKRFH